MSHSEHMAWFRTALGREDVERAIEEAKELAPLNLRDALDLLRLLSRQADPRFDRAANRWLSRLVSERRATLADLQVATAAIGALAIEPDSERAIEALVAVIKGR